MWVNVSKVIILVVSNKLNQVEINYFYKHQGPIIPKIINLMKISINLTLQMVILEKVMALYIQRKVLIQDSK